MKTLLVSILEGDITIPRKKFAEASLTFTQSETEALSDIMKAVNDVVYGKIDQNAFVGAMKKFFLDNKEDVENLLGKVSAATKPAAPSEEPPTEPEKPPKEPPAEEPPKDKGEPPAESSHYPNGITEQYWKEFPKEYLIKNPPSWVKSALNSKKATPEDWENAVKFAAEHSKQPGVTANLGHALKSFKDIIGMA